MANILILLSCFQMQLEEPSDIAPWYSVYLFLYSDSRNKFSAIRLPQSKLDLSARQLYTISLHVFMYCALLII